MPPYEASYELTVRTVKGVPGFTRVTAFDAPNDLTPREASLDLDRADATTIFPGSRVKVTLLVIGVAADVAAE